jgi:hypothetical protein
MRLFLFRVLAKDEIGSLARIARAMASDNINLEGFAVDSAGVQLVTRDREQAEQALESAGIAYLVDEVHEVMLQDRPGALADLCERLAAVGINIATAFGVATGAAGRIYLRVSDLPHAAPILDSVSDGPVIIHRGLGRIPMVGR